MGLDLVEFVMAVEEAFGIQIPDQRAGQLTTPGKVKAFALESVRAAESSACLSQRAYYRLRRSVSDHTGLPARQVRPETSWAELFPKADSRRAAWRDIGATVGFRLPRLVRAPWLVAVSVALVLLGAGAAMLSWKGGGTSALWVAFAVAVTGALVGERLTRPACVRFAAAYATVGAAAQFAATVEPARLKRSREGWTSEEVSRIVDALIVEQFGVREFNDDSDVARDLGID